MKMGIKEFRERLGQVAAAGQPVCVTHHGRIVGHYVPVDSRKAADVDLDRWVAARDRFRARWKAANPDWGDQLLKMGWDEAGEPYANDSRR